MPGPKAIFTLRFLICCGNCVELVARVPLLPRNLSSAGWVAVAYRWSDQAKFFPAAGHRSQGSSILLPSRRWKPLLPSQFGGLYAYAVIGDEPMRSPSIHYVARSHVYTQHGRESPNRTHFYWQATLAATTLC